MAFLRHARLKSESRGPAMASSKDSPGFFRRVARFVSPPAPLPPAPPPPAAAAPPPEAARDSDAAKSELKEMIERKRRNDFVRKRELDMLRKLRREGLSNAQLAALGSSADADDSDVLGEAPVQPDSRVKSKIDQIEQEMGKERPPGPARKAADAATQPMRLHTRSGAASVDTARAALGSGSAIARPAPAAAKAAAKAAPAAEAASSHFATVGQWSTFGPATGIVVTDMQHDPELDAAVMAFANADPASCERTLRALIARGARGADERTTWLLLLDLYRATGQQSAFGALAQEYTQRFQTVPPPWHSIPQALSGVLNEAGSGGIHWTAPARLDRQALAPLTGSGQRWPTPWVLDWRGVQPLDAPACIALGTLFLQLGERRIDMRWLGGPHLVSLLEKALPTGDAAADRACWLARLAIMRMAHQPGRYDDVAIDYASVYHVAPPPWERAQSRVRFIEESQLFGARADTTLGEMTTAFVETTLVEIEGGTPVAEVELSGELVGDISALLERLDQQIGTATTVNVSCRHLVRVDFLASGDLLNWLIAKQREHRRFSFVDAHRLVAMFFAAMGIDQHASVKTESD